MDNFGKDDCKAKVFKVVQQMISEVNGGDCVKVNYNQWKIREY